MSEIVSLDQQFQALGQAYRILMDCVPDGDGCLDLECASRQPLKYLATAQLLVAKRITPAIKKKLDRILERVDGQQIVELPEDQLTEALQKAWLDGYKGQLYAMSRIAYARKAAGMTQLQLAELLGVTQKTVSRWETGTVKPDAKNLFSLSRILNCSMEDLIR